MNKKNFHGFTLIELMVVIAILAIIAAIMIPSLLQARINANETAAIATLRQIAAAETEYAKSHSGKFGTFAELTAGSKPLLPTAFAQESVVRSGYHFELLLDKDNWSVYAWPTSRGETGFQAFRLSSQSDVMLETKASLADPRSRRPGPIQATPPPPPPPPEPITWWELK